MQRSMNYMNPYHYPLVKSFGQSNEHVCVIFIFFCNEQVIFSRPF